MVELWRQLTAQLQRRRLVLLVIPTRVGFQPAANILAASTGGTERVRIDSSGNVGIGTTNPAVSMDFNTKTDGVHLPAGTTARRPTGARELFVTTQTPVLLRRIPTSTGQALRKL